MIIMFNGAVLIRRVLTNGPNGKPIILGHSADVYK